jgi:hypothetical protein
VRWSTLSGQIQSSIDTSTRKSAIINASIAASYTTSRNWQPTDFQNYAIAGSLFIQDDLERTNRRHQHKLLADLSYLKFVDSIWVKGADRLQLNLLWSRNEKNWTHSYSVLFYTQFLPTETSVHDPVSETNQRAHIGGPLVPAGLELSYGATWYPWPASSIQFSFATAKLSSTPKATLQNTNVQHLAEAGNTVLDMQYGASMLVNINHPLTDRIDWMNTSRFFANGLDRDRVNFEVRNRVIIKLWKCLQLRFDTRVGYDPLVNYDLRFSQEIMLGVFYERRRSNTAPVPTAP